MHSVKHLELFSGIGGFRSAFDHLAQDFNFEAECIGFSEIDKYASAVYKACYDIRHSKEIGDIVEFTSNIDNIKALEDFDILTGGFPCQAFSMMGRQKGFEDERGNLFFNILKILNIKKPQFVLLENVRNLKNHDKCNTFKVIKTKLEELGYHVYFDIFNTNNFKLAQTRNRIYIFCSKKKLDNFSFSESDVINSFNHRGNCSLLLQNNVLDVLEKNVDSKYLLSEKIKPTILSDGTGGYISKSEINLLTARPLTATMVKMHRACQDNYYSLDFINSSDPYAFLNEKNNKGKLLESEIRKLTPEEAFELQGFSREMVKRAKEIEISDHQLYKQAGNAASVNVIYAILKYLLIDNKILG